MPAFKDAWFFCVALATIEAPEQGTSIVANATREFHHRCNRALKNTAKLKMPLRGKAFIHLLISAHTSFNYSQTFFQAIFYEMIPNSYRGRVGKYQALRKF